MLHQMVLNGSFGDSSSEVTHGSFEMKTIIA